MSTTALVHVPKAGPTNATSEGAPDTGTATPSRQIAVSASRSASVLPYRDRQDADHDDEAAVDKRPAIVFLMAMRSVSTRVRSTSTGDEPGVAITQYESTETHLAVYGSAVELHDDPYGDPDIIDVEYEIKGLSPRPGRDAMPALPSGEVELELADEIDDEIIPLDPETVPDLTRLTGPASVLNGPATDAQRLLLGKAVEQFTEALNKFASVDGDEVKSARHEVRIPGHEFERMEITFSRSSPEASPVVTVKLIGQTELAPEANFGRSPTEITLDISDRFASMPDRSALTRDEALVELGKTDGAVVLLDALKGFHLDDRDQTPAKSGALLDNSVVNYLATGVDGSRVTRLAHAKVEGFRGALHVSGVVENCTFSNCAMQINNDAGQKAEFRNCTLSKSTMPGCQVEGTLEFSRSRVGKDVLIGMGYQVEKPTTDAGDGKMIEHGKINRLNINGGKFYGTLDVPIDTMNMSTMKWAGFLAKIPVVGLATSLYVGWKYGGMRISERAGSAAMGAISAFSRPWDPNGRSYNPELKDVASKLLDGNAELYRLLDDGSLEPIFAAKDLKDADRFLVKSGKDMIEVGKGSSASVRGWRRPENTMTFRKVELVGGKLAGVTDVSFVEPGSRISTANGYAMLQSVIDFMNASADHEMPKVAKKEPSGAAPTT